MAQEPGDRIRTILAARDRGEAGAFLLGLGHAGVFQRRHLEAVRLVLLACGNLLTGQLARGHRVGATHVLGDLAVGDAFDFERMEFAELGDLFEGEGGVVDQPDSRGFRHEDLGH